MDSIDQVLIAFEDFLADHNIDVYDEAEVAEDKYKLSAVIVEDGMSELKLRLRLQRTIADANAELTSLSKVTLSGLKVNSTSPDEIDFTFTVIFEGEKEEEEKIEEKEEIVIEDAKPAGPTKLAVEVLMDRRNGSYNIVSEFVNEYPDAKAAAQAAKIFEKKKINKFQSALSPENYQKLVADLKEWNGNDQTAFDVFEYRVKLTDSAAEDTKLTDEKDNNLCVCPRCLRGIENHDGPQVTEHFYLEEPVPCDWCGEETDEIYEIFEDRDAENYTTESDEDLGEEIEYFYHDSVKAEDDDTENKKYLTKAEWVDYINRKGEAGKYYGAVLNEKGDKVIFWTGASKGFDLQERAEEYARQQYDLATRGKRIKGAKSPTFITRIAKPAPEQEEYYLVENKNDGTGATHATVYKNEDAAIRSIKANRDVLTRQANYQCEVIDDPSSEDGLAEYYYAEKFTKKDRPTYTIGLRKIDKEEASKFSTTHDEKSVKDDFWGDPGNPSPPDYDDIYLWSDFSRDYFDPIDPDNQAWRSPDRAIGTYADVFQDFVKRYNFKHVDVKEVPKEVQKELIWEDDVTGNEIWFKFNNPTATTPTDNYMVFKECRGSVDNVQDPYDLGTSKYDDEYQIPEILENLGYHQLSDQEIYDKWDAQRRY